MLQRLTLFRETLLQQKTKTQVSLFITLNLLIGFPVIFFAELYVPSLPAIAKYFHSTASYAQYTISYYLFAVAISQLIYGPLSDRYGRRIVLTLGLMICIIGSITALAAPTISTLIVSRIVQGLGVGATMCLVRSITRDVFNATRLAQLSSYISMMFTMAGALAPLLGGYLQTWFGWQANFIFLLSYSIFLFLLCFLFLPETNLHKDSTATQPAVIIKNYKVLLLDRHFMGLLICSGLSTGVILAYYAVGPFLIQHSLNHSPQFYGWTMLILSLAMFSTRLANTRLLKFKSMQHLLSYGVIFMAFGGILMLVFGLLDWLNLFVILFPMIILCIANGFIVPNAMATAMSLYNKTLGSASAIFGFTQMLCASIITTVIASLNIQTLIIFALLLSICGILSCIAFRIGKP